MNQQFRVQRFAAAVPGPDGILPGLKALADLLAQLSGEAVESHIEAIWEEMAGAVPEFEGLRFGAIPETGQLVDGGRFAGLPFVEGPGLHFEPMNAIKEVR